MGTHMCKPMGMHMGVPIMPMGMPSDTGIGIPMDTPMGIPIGTPMGMPIGIHNGKSQPADNKNRGAGRTPGTAFNDKYKGAGWTPKGRQWSQARLKKHFQKHVIAPRWTRKKN